MITETPHRRRLAALTGLVTLLAGLLLAGSPARAAEFAITGVAASYRPGDLLDARVAGVTLDTGQSFQWRVRPIGSTGAGSAISGTGADAATGHLEQVVDAGLDDYELSVRLRSGTTVLHQTAWTPIAVTDLVEPLGVEFTGPSPAYLGDPITGAITGRQLDTGETVALVARTTGRWTPALFTTIDGRTISSEPLSPFDGEWAIQVVRDGIAVAQSEPVAVEYGRREVLLEGVQGVYRVGQTLRVSGTVHPVKDGLRYSWILRDNATFEAQTFDAGTDPANLALELPMTLAEDDHTLTLVAWWDYREGHTANAGQAAVPINVSDADPSTPLLFFNSLGDHYHQGSPINLQLAADPPLADGDTVAWEWRWPGGNWTAVPGATGLSHQVVAEQALDGVEVRATLTAASGGDPLVAEPVTIHVDDHGAPPHQRVTIGGVADGYAAGDEITLTASVEPGSVLDRWEWYVQRAGESEPTLIDGAHTAQFRTAATADLHGATMTARLTFADGTPYVESAPVTLNVEGGPSQRIVATLPEDEGALVVSVDPEDDVVTMSDFELGTAADRWTSTGDLRPVTVTDTRATAPGWVVSGQVGDFTNGGDILDGKHLGWTPLVTEQPDDGGVTPGAAVTPGLATGDGLSISNPLASAPAGDGTGTSRLGAGLLIEAPTTLVPGTYEATITFTAI
ncbi:hypothetical protein E1212_27845 [Jiangella ureilytica]|uniref:WxL domain-containing protein n=1 Tax=Jiangella ureilytica TaxID=2530374 RepID=A0A4R4RAK5_9ACTN|nr:hypothetical protein [Jiangella ureilytica]TDC46020.1 hypothetical protein E1212_27845 [Jiangella ureilytica]